MRLIGSLSLFLLSISIAFSQTPCVDGHAGAYPCSNVDLLSRLSTDDLLADDQDGVYLNDIWGWTDPDTGKEYAIVGMANGTSFVDVSDPLNPVMLGILPEHHMATSARTSSRGGANSVWRDIKVYKNHAFIVSEDVGHGMQIIDLTRLRNVTNPPVEFPEDANYQNISNAHNIVINEETGFAYAVGANGGSTCAQGGLHIIDISEPKNPTYVACFDQDGYTHDAQCVVYQGPDSDYQGKEICFNLNEDHFVIVDVSDKTNMTLLAKEGYSGVEYSHQGWLTDDHRFFLSNDELDEYKSDSEPRTRTFIWNVEDLNNPVLIGTHEHGTQSIDHNLYIKGNHVYQSNYTAGLRILDLQRVASGHLIETGYFDTYPNHDNARFWGSWSNYPYFESGIVIVTDIENGLFVLQPNLPQITLSVDEPMGLVHVYPNPSNTNSELTVNIMQTATYELMDIQGKLVSSGVLSASDNQISLNGLTPGIHLLNIKNDGVRLLSEKILVR